MDRITRSMVAKAFELLVKTLKGRIATSYNDVGAYRLDYNGVYGGFVIEQIMSETGGITCPFSHGRMKAREAFEAYHFARKVLEAKEAR